MQAERQRVLEEVRQALTRCPVVSIDREKHPHGDILGMRRSDASKALASLGATSPARSSVSQTEKMPSGCLGNTAGGGVTNKSTPSISEVARDIDFAIDVTEPRAVLLKRFEDILTAWRATW